MSTEKTEKLSALDATFLELEEADESAHMHIGGVMVLEPHPDGAIPSIDEVRAEIVSRLGRLPRYTQRLSEPRTGGLRWQSWEPDPAFDIANHVRVEAIPAPAGIDELREWAGEYFSIRLDRRRPLWEMIVAGLGDGRWAMITKTHHCLVDGVGSVDAAKVLLDPVRERFADAEPEPIPEQVPDLDTGDGGRLAPVPPRRRLAATHRQGDRRRGARSQRRRLGRRRRHRPPPPRRRLSAKPGRPPS